MKTEKNDFIPVETINKGIWYMDVSNLTLSELFELRNSLLKKSNASISVLDGIIHSETGTGYDNTNFRKREFERRKQGYRNKQVLIKMKRRKR